MDELVDELSGTTLEVGANKDVPMKAKNIKPSNRTASIINRSKLLILSDSESDDENVLDRNRFSKHLRISKSKSGTNWKTKHYSRMLAKGKRKRNSAPEMTAACHLLANNSSINSSGCSNQNPLSMDIEHADGDSDSSGLSDDSPTECNFDGDDEQSDFYDSSSSTTPCFRYRTHCHSRPKHEFKIPSKPVNPFLTVDLEPSINLWKRRRPLH